MKAGNWFNRSRRIWMVALSGACLLGMYEAAPAREALLSAVTLAPVTIEPEPLDGVAPDAEQQERVRILAKQVTEHIHHWVLKKQLAGAVTDGVKRNTLENSPPAHPTLSATVRLPISLPRDLQSRRQVFQRERLVTVQVTMQLSDGTKIEVEEVLNGKDIHLAKRRRQQLTYSRGINWVLELYAEKAVDRALGRLLERMASHHATTQVPTNAGKGASDGA
jgi:hypothetical protein